MKLIPLTRGKYAKVDDDMYEELMLHKWFYQPHHLGYTGYTLRHPVTRAVKSGGSTTERMHRVICGTSSLPVDHIDHDGLNNQRSNLRVSTRSKNAVNRRARPSHNKSGYLGVHLHMGRYEAGVRKNQVMHYAGRFATAREAAIARDNKAIELFGEFAQTNKKLGYLNVA